MHCRPKIMTQRDAAAYLSSLGHRIDESALSRMGKYGDGPRFERLGTTKVFFKIDLDLWHENNPPDTQEDNMRDRGKPVGGC